MPGDRESRRDLAEALDNVGGEPDDDLVRDPVGPAIYRMDPGRQATVVACLRCRHLGLIPSIPRKPKLVWTCPGCGHGWALEPPPRVWIEGSRPTVLPARLV
jgi:hypothetical protein